MSHWTLDQLQPAMRRQAEAKLRAGAVVRTHIVMSEPHQEAKLSVSKEVKTGLPKLPRRARKLLAPQKLLLMIESAGLPAPVLEHQFTPERKFRFDMCWPARMVALEIDGGTWTGGRHVSGLGYERDCVKINLATAQGWRVFRVTTRQAENSYAIELLRRALAIQKP